MNLAPVGLRRSLVRLSAQVVAASHPIRPSARIGFDPVAPALAAAKPDVAAIAAQTSR